MVSRCYHAAEHIEGDQDLQDFKLDELRLQHEQLQGNQWLHQWQGILNASITTVLVTMIESPLMMKAGFDEVEDFNPFYN